MEPLITQLLVMFSGGMVVTSLTPTRLANVSRRWWQIAALVALAAFAANLIFSLAQASKPENNLLTRDVVAWVVLAGGNPLLIARVVLGSKVVWLRTGAAVLTLAVLAGTTPFVMLLVHCTSGDCL